MPCYSNIRLWDGLGDSYADADSIINQQKAPAQRWIH